MAKVNVLNFQLDKKKELCKIGVWSAKGGVGKTTISIALANSLSKSKEIGLVDADITCPNITAYLEIEDELIGDKKKNIIYPLKRGNLEIISMGSLIKSSAVVWRGVMLSKAIEDFINRVEWKAKTLVIDLPPGTSDVLITTANTIGINKLLLVTTPSKLAINELLRSIDFMKRFNVEIVGIIENMVSDVYPSIKEKIEEKTGIKVLASFKYEKRIADAIEKGKSIDEIHKKEFKEISKYLNC